MVQRGLATTAEGEIIVRQDFLGGQARAQQRAFGLAVKVQHILGGGSLQALDRLLLELKVLPGQARSAFQEMVADARSLARQGLVTDRIDADAVAAPRLLLGNLDDPPLDGAAV